MIFKEIKFINELPKISRSEIIFVGQDFASDNEAYNFYNADVRNRDLV